MSVYEEGVSICGFVLRTGIYPKYLKHAVIEGKNGGIQGSCLFVVVHEAKCILWKEYLSSNGRQFHQCQQNEEPLLNSNHLTHDCL